ncbi:MAG: exo-alpha-sialidase [Chloroflexi bacterium]|nr:exo-alpha-sialidase [Chloroflexota bacterium]
MKHTVVYKRPGYYSMGPVLQLLPDGRLAVGLISSPFADHYGLADWVVVVSEDQGESFHLTDDPTIPLTWPGANTRERYDRFAAIMPDGSYLASGTVGFEVWPVERQQEAVDAGLQVEPHPDHKGDTVVVAIPKMFVQRSRDQGESWQRQEWDVPGFSGMTAFPRSTRLADGTILVPVYAYSHGEERSQTFVWRSADGGDTWHLIPMASSVADMTGDEMGFIEAEPGRVLALLRFNHPRSRVKGYLLESWSNDSGATWSVPMSTGIKGHPPHMLRLQDGRILCVVTYRYRPMGIHAVLSSDNGRTWDTKHTIILRDDGGSASTLRPNYATTSGASDIGYPITVQFADGSLFTSYWFTMADGITHAAGTKWRVD